MDQELGPSESSTDYQTFTLSNLPPGTTYYWQVVSRTMANLTRTGDVWSFTTAGTAAPPPLNGVTGPGDILLYAQDAQITGTKWSSVSDATAAGGGRLWNKNLGAAKITTAVTNPTDYVRGSTVLPMDARVGSDTIRMGQTVFVGLGVSSHTTASTATATFDNVDIH